MATTVNQAFKEFIENALTISSSVKEMANGSVDALKNQIDILSDKCLIPKTASSKHYLFGSFSRRTKNPPLDDIDLIICFSACGSVNIYENRWDDIKLVVDGDNKQLLDLCDKKYKSFYSGEFENELNSNKFKNKLVSSLNSVQYYKKAELHARGEAVTLSLSSYEWTFDIVPAFFYEDNSEIIFVIPNGSGRWKKTNPKKEKERINNLNKLFKNMVSKVVRLVKYWNRRGKMPTMTSYVLETMVLDYFDSLQVPEESETLYPDLLFRDILHYISSNIYSSIYDSKGIEGDINTLSYLDRYKLMIRSNNDHQKACSAVEAELEEKDFQKSIDIWRSIFGDEFPKYE